MNFEGPLSIEIYVKHKEHMAKKAFLSMGYSFWYWKEWFSMIDNIIQSAFIAWPAPLQTALNIKQQIDTAIFLKLCSTPTRAFLWLSNAAF